MKTQNNISGLMKTLFVFIILIFSFADSRSQFQILDYDMNCSTSTTRQEYGRSIINRGDRGYAISGFTYQSPSCIGNYDWFLLKLKENGMVDCSDIVGLSRDDKNYSLIQMNDSGYVLSGYFTNTASPYRKRATWVRYNKNCTPLNARAVFDTLNSTYYQVVRDPNQNNTHAGFIETHITVGFKRNKILAAQYSVGGAPLWVSRYNSGGLSVEEAMSICYQPTDASYGLAIKTNYYSGSTGVFDLMLMKLTSAGAIIWKKVYRIISTSPNIYPNTEPRKIIPLADGGFAVVGFTNAYGTNQRDVVVLRVTAAGSVVWYNTYGSTGLFETGESITLDGQNLVIAGSERTVSPAGSPNVFTMKVPLAGGAPVWSKRWDSANPTDIGYDIVRSTMGASNGYAVTGHTTRGTDQNNAILYRVNIDGIVPGTTCVGNINSPWYVNHHRLDSFNLVRQTVNEITSPFNHVNPVTDPDTLCIAPPVGPLNGEEIKDRTEGEVKEFKMLQNSPNPFNPSTTINFEIPVSSYLTIKVFDVSGRLISTLVNEFKEQGRHSVFFDGSMLSSGIYYYKLESQGITDVKKMILIK